MPTPIPGVGRAATEPRNRFHAVRNGADFTPKAKELLMLITVSVPSTTATALAIRDPASAMGLSTIF